MERLPRRYAPSIVRQISAREAQHVREAEGSACVALHLVRTVRMHVRFVEPRVGNIVT